MADSNFVNICFGKWALRMARPASYEDLEGECRAALQKMSSVSELLVLFEDPPLSGRHVELRPGTYDKVQDDSILHVNVCIYQSRL